jgi:hypothetical protein
LPSSSLPFEGASVNDFPLQGMNTIWALDLKSPPYTLCGRAL